MPGRIDPWREFRKENINMDLYIVSDSQILHVKGNNRDNWVRVYEPHGSRYDQIGILDWIRVRSFSNNFGRYWWNFVRKSAYRSYRPSPIFLLTPKSKTCLGNTYFQDLINRSMIQPVGINDEGKALACRVHDMVLDLIRSISKTRELPYNMGWYRSNQILVRLQCSQAIPQAPPTTLE